MRARALWLAVLTSLWFGLGPVKPALAQTPEIDGTRYEIGQTGSVTDLGIRVTVSPDVGPRGVRSFVVGVRYKDPTYPSSQEVEILAPTIFHVSCENPRGRLREDPLTWWNTRDVGFAVELTQVCRRLDPDVVVPVLEVQLWCSEPETERRYLALMKEGRLFDIAPAGTWEHVENEVGRTLTVAQGTFKAAGAIFTVMDLVALSRGGITAGRFVMKLVVGVAVDEVVDYGFDYARREWGYELVFDHEGWDVRCRRCGTVFHRDTLTDGEILRCPNSTCPAEVVVHFD